MESPEGIGSVEAAISLHGQKFNGRNKKDLPSESRELQRVQMEMRRLKETKKSADKEKARAQLELLKAKSAARELALEIEKSNAKAMARKLELPSARNLDVNDQKYSELMRELSSMKQELSRLKLDVAAALESKARAEKMIEASKAKVKSCTSSAEEIGKEIEEANEEHTLVEIARIEAERETREIEAQRRDEADRFSMQIESTKEKIVVLQKKARQAKDLETKLAVTNSDLSVLQSEMELVRAMERNFQKSKLEEESLLKSAKAELKGAKKELASIKEEGFQYMTSMDVIRKELMFITKEAETLKKQEMKTDSSIQQLNARLLKAKSKLESVSASEERSKAVVSNLSAALQDLRAELEAVKEEREMIAEETERTKQKVESSEKKMRSAEERLRAAMVELEAAKASEAVALKQLRDVAERTMKERASSLARSSTVTISKAEHDYLTRGAESAKMVADKKAAAARAWIEAVKAEEKEILMKTEFVEKEIKHHKTAEGEELVKIEKALYNGLGGAEEAQFLDRQLPVAAPKRPMRENRMSMGSARKMKKRRSSASSGIRHSPRSPSFTIKRKTTVMPNLVKFLRRGSIRTQK